MARLAFRIDANPDAEHQLFPFRLRLDHFRRELRLIAMNLTFAGMGVSGIGIEHNARFVTDLHMTTSCVGM